MTRYGHFIHGERTPGQTGGRPGEVYNPSTGEVSAVVDFADGPTIDRAVASALAAQPEWARTSPQRRARVMFNFKSLLEANMDDLARLLSEEHGKVLTDARGDLQRGLEVVEFACGVPHLLKGEYSHAAGPGIDVFAHRQPVGVAAGITPFNFPAMIPMWMFAVAVACGNAFVLKPSERNPGVPLRLAELLLDAGAPPGVLNVVNGDRAAVEALVAHPAVHAVSFVGSSAVARQVYAACAANGKRVQAMGGAKNHGIVLPDADMNRVARDIVGAAFGSAGERCMAMPVAVPVGENTAERLRAELLRAIAELKVGIATDPAADYGPVVSRAHLERVTRHISTAIAEGSELVLDGRSFALQGFEKGFFLGPTLLDRVQPHMSTYQEEIFGPVLQIVRAASFDEAVRLPSEHPYGNGATLFTESGAAARAFADRVQVGMVGINVPIPVPLAYHSFGGWKQSAFGDTNQHGLEGVRFYTRQKTVTQRWPGDSGGDHAFVIPTLS